MSNLAIHVENISKRYRIGLKEELHDTFIGALASWIKYPLTNFKRLQKLSKFSENGESEDIIWALKDVSFEVKHGEVLGIIGLNGAGKSTLLKILCRVTEPTSGRAGTYGRMSSLLEVGTGFHPELTGRENVFLNGAILGMTKKEIEQKFDEIVNFSGVEKFIDTPVKRYSSGMYVRLAFAVAAHLDPEILLVDEVLAVGDAKFQKKCLRKMEEVSKGGRTVLFVSHNMGSISTLCEKTMLLKEGHLDFIGPSQQAVSTYLGHLGSDAGLKKEWDFEEAPGGKIGRIKSITITDHQGVEKLHFSTAEPIFVTLEYWVLSDDTPVNIGFFLYDENGIFICAVGNYKETRIKDISKKGLYRSMGIIPGDFLNSGRHTVTIEFIANLTEVEARVPHCAVFETVDDKRVHPFYSRWGGVIKPEFEWQSKRISDIEGNEYS